MQTRAPHVPVAHQRHHRAYAARTIERNWVDYVTYGLTWFGVVMIFALAATTQWRGGN